MLVLMPIFCTLCDGACSCRSGGGFPAYDFLSDPAINIDMSNYDEIAGDNLGYQQRDMSDSTVSGRDKEANDAAANSWSIGSLSLELDGNSHVSLKFLPSSDEIFGKGNLTLGNKTNLLGAFGKLSGDRLVLDMVLLSGNLYRLDLARFGSSISGNYERISSDGHSQSGTATGNWSI
jgi:hypothetical protein